MGMLKTLSIDIEDLVNQGYDDQYIAKAVGEDLNVIKYIINYFRCKPKKVCVEKSKSRK